MANEERRLRKLLKIEVERNKKLAARAQRLGQLLVDLGVNPNLLDDEPTSTLAHRHRFHQGAGEEGAFFNWYTCIDCGEDVRFEKFEEVPFEG